MHAKRLNRVHRIPLGEPLPADAELFYQPGPLCRVRRHQRSRPKFSRNGEPRFRRGPLHSNAEARAEKEQALELKLILSSDTHGWNISENFIAEKPLNYSDPWEFAYALGVGRPLTLKAKSKSCVFCCENFVAGLELYGGLGITQSFGLNGTSHCLGPIVQFNVPRGPSIGCEPSFGLNASRVGLFWRFRVSYEVEQHFSYFRRS